MSDAGDLVDMIAHRLRDPGNIRHSRADVRDILGRVQTLINAAQNYVLERTGFMTIPGQTIYRMATHFPNLVTVTDIEVDLTYLDRVSWRNFWKVSQTWQTDVGQPRAWSMIGRGLVVIYPVPGAPFEVFVQGPKICTALTDDAIPLDLRGEDMDSVLDLTTAIYLLRQRDTEDSRILMTRARDKLGIQGLAKQEEMRFG